MAHNEPKRGKNWTEEEDEQLCRSWLHISKDSVKGTDQQKGDFWKSIKCHAEAHLPTIANRPCDGLRQRFSVISHQISKYGSCVAFVNRLNSSGTSAEDRAQKARDMFLRDTNQKHFRILSCFEILKDEPKFKAQEDVHRLTKKKQPTNAGEPGDTECINADIQETMSSTPSSSRPIGQKRAKLAQQTESPWNAVWKEMKRKNDLLESHTKAIERSIDLKIIMASPEGLDPLSKQLLLNQKQQLLETMTNKDQSLDGTEELFDEDDVLQNAINIDEFEF